MRKSIITAVLLIAAAIMGAFLAQAETVEITNPETGFKISIQTVIKEGEEYLFLPPWADLQNVVFAKSGKVNLLKSNKEYKPGNRYAASIKGRKVRVIVGSEVPQLFITLGEGYTVDYMGLTKENRAYGGGVVKVTDGVPEDYSMEYMHARGNNMRASKGKFSYLVKLDSKQELIPEAGKAKKWVLTSNSVHTRSNVGNYAALTLYDMMGGSYAMKHEAVDVYINGKYVGLYMLSEKVEINKNRVNIAETENDEDKDHVTRVVGSHGLFGNGKTDFVRDHNQERYPSMGTLCENVETVMYKTAAEDANDPAIAAGIRAYQYTPGSKEKEAGGFLLEFEFRFKDVASWFVTRRGTAIAVNTPEYATREQVQEIAIYVQAFEDALFSDSGINQFGKHYSEYMDLDSLAKLISINTFISNVDTFLTSTFFVVDRKDGELQMIVAGPAWDFDFHEFNIPGLVNENILQWKGTADIDMPLRPWIERCFTRADIVENIYKLWHGAFGEAAHELVDTLLPQFNELTFASNRMNFYLLQDDNTDQFYIQEDTKGIARRVDKWDRLVSTNYMTGGHIEVSDGGLALVAMGKCTRTDWYYVNEDGSMQLVRQNGGSSFTPDRSGVYVAAITGPNMLYTGGRGIFGKNSATMYTAPIRFE